MCDSVLSRRPQWLWREAGWRNPNSWCLAGTLRRCQSQYGGRFTTGMGPTSACPDRYVCHLPSVVPPWAFNLCFGECHLLWLFCFDTLYSWWCVLRCHMKCQILINLFPDHRFFLYCFDVTLNWTVLPLIIRLIFFTLLARFISDSLKMVNNDGMYSNK